MVLALYHSLARDRPNLFFSPHSIAEALGMLHGGARTETRSEIETVLGRSGEGIHDEFFALRRELASRSQLGDRERQLLRSIEQEAAYTGGEVASADRFGCHLHIANGLWCQQGYAICPAYDTLLRNKYQCGVSAADFAGHPEGAVRAVNAWVARETHGKIREMLQQVDPLTRLILANAIYFEARWDSPFHPPLTRPAPFHRLDGSRVEVQMMSQTCHLSRYEDDHVQAVRLPYTGNRISLVLVAPRLGFFETHGTGPESLRVADRLEPGITQISMPRFRIAAGLQLSRALGELGMPNAFGTTADFSGISPELGFHVDEVLHQTFIDVDEEGTVAAAVTMPIMAGASMPRDIAEITLDRPFVFAIRDEPTGAILFAGRLADPLQP